MKARLLGFCAAVFVFAALASFVVAVHHYDVTTSREITSACEECLRHCKDIPASQSPAKLNPPIGLIVLDPCEPIAASYPGEGWACTKFGGPIGSELCCRWQRGHCHDFPNALNCAD